MKAFITFILNGARIWGYEIDINEANYELLESQFFCGSQKFFAMFAIKIEILFFCIQYLEWIMKISKDN